MNALSYSSNGTKASQKVNLDKGIFEVDIKNMALIKEAYDSYLANGRINLANTKTRGLVRGGGRKPWRQKGTGRARFGSSRNPIWRGGGVVFGPTGHENYVKRLNTKAKRAALRQSLSLAAKDSKVSVIDDIKLKTHKTSELNKLLNKLHLDGTLLLVVDQISKELSLASNNMPNILITRESALNVYDVINADHLLITKSALTNINKRLGEAK